MLMTMLQPYQATVLAGPDHRDARDSHEFLSVSDDQAWGKAHEWIDKNTLVEDGDYLQLSENGRGVRGTLIRKVT